MLTSKPEYIDVFLGDQILVDGLTWNVAAFHGEKVKVWRDGESMLLPMTEARAAKLALHRRARPLIDNVTGETC